MWCAALELLGSSLTCIDNSTTTTTVGPQEQTGMAAHDAMTLCHVLPAFMGWSPFGTVAAGICIYCEFQSLAVFFRFRNDVLRDFKGALKGPQATVQTHNEGVVITVATASTSPPEGPGPRLRPPCAP